MRGLGTILGALALGALLIALPSSGSASAASGPGPMGKVLGWHNVTRGRSGPESQVGAMAYDPPAHELVLWESETGNARGRVNVTWTYGAGTWTNVTASVAPSPRAWPAMAYDPLLGAVLLFGGFDNGPSGGSGLGDTWEFQNNTWTQLFPAHAPSARGGASMVFDPALGTMVLFGGSPSFTSRSPSSGTVWTFGRNGTWVPGPSRNLSGSLTWSGIAYDTALRQVVVFGGMPYAGCGCETNTTWVLTGRAWHTVSAPASLYPRLWVQMAYDRALNATVLYGGTWATSGSGFKGYNDTWTYSARGWSPLRVSGPGIRGYGYLAWSPTARGVVLFGGIQSGGTNPYAQSIWVLR